MFPDTRASTGQIENDSVWICQTSAKNGKRDFIIKDNDISTTYTMTEITPKQSIVGGLRCVVPAALADRRPLLHHRTYLRNSLVAPSSRLLPSVVDMR